MAFGGSLSNASGVLKSGAARAAEVAKRKAQGTGKDALERVKNQSKESRDDISKGGATVQKSQVTSTKTFPSKYSSYAKAPDYYRNGLLTTEQVPVSNDQTTEVRRYNPIPELMMSTADDYKGVLASIKLIDPRKVKKKDNGSPQTGQVVPEYTKFFLESVQEAHNEKVQIVETFNDFYAFFYGERPPVYTFSGHLLNLLNYNWMNEFLYYYSNFWRGTKASELGAKIYLTYNYQQIQGYILSMNTNVQAMTDKAAPFNIQVLVTNRQVFSGTKDDSFVRDALLPRTDTGFINLEASHFSVALADNFLKGHEAAASTKKVKDETSDRSSRTLKDKAESAKEEKFAGGDEASKKWFETSDSKFIAEGGSVSDLGIRGAKRSKGFLSGLFG